ncbi:UvrD-helicase domain-containing protein [Planctopirus hydrillae]|uniref:DNA 3'-5' helicase II n=1 Tax=Planctopirus hydrillae TaxID=1841610 RepID=A0A1C3EGZ1_9PLAN|nr:UvrD-helicase domain-containing protein [Planctopirus hydrillae]ODA32488.1 hypothetical protein A6X21_19120 [Planctopirus hydrillae]
MNSILPFDDLDLPHISDEDIDQLAARTSLRLDDERRLILRNMSRVDVRACPGSGKTTLLVAKLAILAAKWKLRSRGICVLSHTNVARREIQSRFGQFPALQCLNAYPHFVGTIQSFIDQFLGVHGALSAFGRRPAVIDNDRYRFEACKEFFSGPQYNTARMALQRFYQGNLHRTSADCISEIEYCDSALSLTPIPSKSNPWGEAAPSIVLLKALKNTLSRRGYFRFKDMDALALHYLERNSVIVASLRRRFPVVFVDEMQDTSQMHAGILETLFGEGVVFQRIGDDRQAIYSDSAPEDDANGSSFPRPAALTMSKSYRLSPLVSSLVQNLCSGEVEQIQGNQDRRDGRHSILVFTRQNIVNVLPKFAELVAEDVGTDLPANLVRAVGAVQKDKGESDKFPASIPQYWPAFDPPRRDKITRGQSLGVFVQSAAAHVRTNGNVGAAMRCLVEAVSRVMCLQSGADSTVDIRPHALPSSLQQVSPQAAKRLKTSLAEFLLFLSDPSVAVTMDSLGKITAVLKELCPGKWKGDASQFWQLTIEPVGKTPVGAQTSSEAVETGTNIFQHHSSHGKVEVMVDTIHSVKGETLRAVLVLDTFQNTQHLGSLIQSGHLLGTRPANKPGKQLDRHLKRAFVAATRPTHLLCIALCSDYVNDTNRAEFKKLGWQVVDV